jgi:oligoribonuclease NrnB/cAMP/cGMP phosphodiesterase (DHH superfamily)
VFKILIVSHIADLDGVASAVLAYRHLAQTRNVATSKVISVSFVNYDNAFDTVIEESQGMDEVWICDLSWKMSDVDLINHLTHIHPDKLLFFDHHRSSRECFEAWKDHATFFFDDSGEYCTTDLIWSYMRSCGHAPDELLPIVSAAHSRDLWIKNDPNGCAISSVISELGALTVFQALIEDPDLIHVSNFPREWQNICHRAEQKLEASYQAARNTLTKTTIRNEAGVEVPLMACIAQGCVSDVGDRILSEENGGFIGLIDLVHGRLSFRSTHPTIKTMGFGVNEIALRLHPNSGGHPVAAGAKCGSRHLTDGPNALLQDMLEAVADFQKQAAEKATTLMSNLKNSS